MVIDDLVEIAEKERAARKKYVIRCCMAAGCMSSDSKGVKEALDKAVKEAGLEDQVEVRGVGCMKLCCQGPLVQVDSTANPLTTQHATRNRKVPPASRSKPRPGPALPEGHGRKTPLPSSAPSRAARPTCSAATRSTRSSPSNCPSCWRTAASWTRNASSPTSRRRATRRCTTCCAR